jgi:hypothetical protein
MLIIRESVLSGEENSMELDVTEEQMIRWKNGELIQHVMPHLSPDEREFIMTGITQDEWRALESKAEFYGKDY